MHTTQVLQWKPSEEIMTKLCNDTFKGSKDVIVYGEGGSISGGAENTKKQTSHAIIYQFPNLHDINISKTSV